MISSRITRMGGHSWPHTQIEDFIWATHFTSCMLCVCGYSFEMGVKKSGKLLKLINSKELAAVSRATVPKQPATHAPSWLACSLHKKTAKTLARSFAGESHYLLDSCSLLRHCKVGENLLCRRRSRKSRARMVLTDNLLPKRFSHCPTFGGARRKSKAHTGDLSHGRFIGMFGVSLRA